MKNILMIGILAIGFAGCGGATDGDPKTDTTSMPVDTNLNKTDVNHINRADGTKMADTSRIDSDSGFVH